MLDKSHTVYYAFSGMCGINESPNLVSEIVNIDLEPLLPNLHKKYGDDIDTKHILNCYALQKELKNTFIYRSPISFDVNYTEDERLYTIDGVNINSQSEFDLLINNTDVPTIYQLLSGFGLCVISNNNSLPISIQPANYHKTEVSKFPIVTGSFDCAKWFRPIHLAVFNKDKVDFKVRRGDPLFYIKFHTDNKIKLKRFLMTSEITSIMKATVTTKNYIKNTKLAKLYELFTKSKLKPKLMKLIQSE
jgi:hypothetical protein